MWKYVLLALLAGSAMASDNRDSRSLSNCRVSKFFEHRSFSNRCFSDEVMTGIVPGDPNSIYCAKLRVDCSRGSDASTSVNRPEETIDADGDTGTTR